MKNNCKNKKLKTIRLKNNLRLGITKFYLTEKVSNTLEETTLSEDYINRLVEIANKSLMKTYKLKLGKTEIRLLGMMNDDFIKNLRTNVVVLQRGQGTSIQLLNK